MTKLHFEDLTKITCPFGMLDDDTQTRLLACGETEFWNGFEWGKSYCLTDSYTYRAKPKPKRVVRWVQYDEGNVGLHCESYDEANYCLEAYGGYIYRIERNEDGSNPTIELVEMNT